MQLLHLHPSSGAYGIGSVILTGISLATTALPVVQFIAAIIAIVAGLLSIYKWFRS